MARSRPEIIGPIFKWRHYQLLAEFDVVPAIASYNAGAGAVRRHRGIPPYAETRRFVARVLLRYLDASAAGPVNEVEPHPSTE